MSIDYEPETNVSKEERTNTTMAMHQSNLRDTQGRISQLKTRSTLGLSVSFFLVGFLCLRLTKTTLSSSLSCRFFQENPSIFLGFGEDSIHRDNARSPLAFLRKQDARENDDFFEPNVIFGNYSMPITFDTKHSNAKEIQKAFDVGLVECYGFAFYEARKTANKILQDLRDNSHVNSRETSTDDEPFCPMCYWLLAMGYSPYINHPLIEDPSYFESALNAANKAYEQAFHHPPNALTSSLSTKELGLINALQLRFSPPSTFQNQIIGFKYYKNTLRDLYEDIMENGTGDADVNAFLADSIMVLHSDRNGYHFYDENTGQAKPEISYAISLLEDCLDIDPDHPLCQHLYIHITEPSDNMVSYSEAVADNLLAKTTGTEAGHLQHMPSHTYVRLGRYHDAIRSNVEAHKSDQSYEQHSAVAYGVAHDLAVLIYAAGMSGERSVAMAYADELRQNYRDYPNRHDGPGTEMGWHIWRTIHLCFGDFAAILDDDDGIPGGKRNAEFETNRESTSWPYAIVLGHYAKGVASLWNTDTSVDKVQRLLKAKFHLEKLRDTIPKVDPGFQGMVSVADASLDASIQFYQIQKNNLLRTIEHFEPVLKLLQSARAEQDSWGYTEPPLWHTNLKLCEGTLLRKMGKYSEAKEVFNADLIGRPENRYALYGLWKVMEESGASDEKTKQVRKRFEEASSWADESVKNNPPLVCPELGE